MRFSGLDTLGPGDEHVAGCREHGHDFSGSMLLILILIYRVIHKSVKHVRKLADATVE